MTATRRLAAILAADVAGYSRLIGADEGGTLQALKAIRAELIDPTIAAHNGRLVKTTGDGLAGGFHLPADVNPTYISKLEKAASRDCRSPPSSRRAGVRAGDAEADTRETDRLID
jgi:adenylate cyclase